MAKVSSQLKNDALTHSPARPPDNGNQLQFSFSLPWRLMARQTGAHLRAHSLRRLIRRRRASNSWASSMGAQFRTVLASLLPARVANLQLTISQS